MDIRNHLPYLLLVISLFFGCKTQTDAPLPMRKTAAGQVPSESHFLLRAYPDAYPDMVAYRKGMVQARLMAAEKNAGFDHEWTVQGPGNIGARVNTLAVHPHDENIIYAGFSSGGAWKTTDGGANWSPIFDDQLWPSIGHIVMDPNNPETIYVGTGDPNISFYPMLGDGVYKSTDGGATWTNIGLQDKRVITKILVHPTDPNTLYAASMGLPFIRDNDRGLYRTTNGGATWQQVLFISDQAGVIDLVMDPFDPNTIYASGWDRVRSNQESIVTGPGAKVFKTTDGGNTWTELTNGLPSGEMGRTGLAISQQTPGLLYVMYVGTNSQLYDVFRTTNGGASWEPVGSSGAESALGGFGWYFGKLRIHPEDDNMIYLLGVELWLTYFGIGEWNMISPPWWLYEVHADLHDLVFTSSGNAYLGTDGGLYRSSDDGVSWVDIDNIPTTQFYRVAYNPHQPDRYYGGAQDNGTTGGNAQNIDNWPRIYGGDGFQPAFHPQNPNIFYAESQNGGIVVTTNGGASFSSATSGIPSSDRRNWDMPYFLSPHNPSVIYTGTFRVFRSTAGTFPSFQAVSTDLTDGLVLHPRHHNITTLSESPILEGLLYAGTADGNVWRADNSTFNWINISAGLPDRYVTEVKASPDNLDWVYVTHSGYRDNEFIPRVHRSTNRGANWTDISANLPDIAINDIYILPGHADSVIFVATDAGVYATINNAQTWGRLGKNMPFVPVFDLEWNPAHNTLIAGTFARSIMTYPIDSLLKMPPPDTTVAIRPTLANDYEEVKIFPNPARHQVTVTCPGTPGKTAEIVLLDRNGSLVQRVALPSQQNIEQRLNISALPAGEYFVKVKTGQLIRKGRFVKG